MNSRESNYRDFKRTVWGNDVGLALVNSLIARLGAPSIAVDVPLAQLCRWRVGGTADIVVTPPDTRALARTLVTLEQAGVPLVVVGDGTNLLFDDAGYRGAIVKLGAAFRRFDYDGHDVVTAGAGMWVPCFVRRSIAAGLSGAEHAIGIPGTLGGLLVMNGGSQRKGIGDHVVSVETVDRQGTVRHQSRDEMAFRYRHSNVSERRLTVVGASFRFTQGNAAQGRHAAIAILAQRRAKFPDIRANCGSVFVSDPALYRIMGSPGAAIERCGLKGARIGNAQISAQHANFIVNLGGAKAHDILALIALARQRVEEATGIAMTAEVRYLPPEGQPIPAHLCAAALFPQRLAS